MVEARAPASYQVEPDFAARQSVLWAVAWVVAASIATLVVDLLMLFPGAGDGIPVVGSVLSYGRLHPVAETALVFGFLVTSGFAAVYAIFPRITGVQLHNEVLGAATTLTWTVTVLIGMAALKFGLNQGRPMAELPIGVDAAMLIMLVLVLFNAGVTVARRREPTLYASGWYLLAVVILAPVIFLIGNLPVFTGATDVIVSGFYQNGLELLWLLPIGLGIAHYVIPVETGNPLYSVAVARASFWSLVFVGGWPGQRFYMKSLGPDYLESIAFAMSVVLLVPVVSSVVNLVATGRERWGLLQKAFGLRWAVAGLGLLVVWIGLLVGGTVPWVSRLVGSTSYSSAVRHLGSWGVFSAFAFALIYHVYPLMVGRDWYSRRLSSFHFWGTLAGVSLGVVALLGLGLVQTTTLVTTDAAGLSGAIQASVTVQRFVLIGVTAAAALVAAAQCALAYNTYRTARFGPLMTIAETVPVGSPV